MNSAGLFPGAVTRTKIVEKSTISFCSRPPMTTSTRWLASPRIWRCQHGVARKSAGQRENVNSRANPVFGPIPQFVNSVVRALLVLPQSAGGAARTDTVGYMSFVAWDIDVEVFVAHAKLPDDLQVVEYAQIVLDITRLIHVGQELRFGWHNEERSSAAQVNRVQYGSDFMMVLAIAGGLATVTYTLAKALDMLAAAGLKNEERLGKRAERLAKSTEPSAVELAQAADAIFVVVDEQMSSAWRLSEEDQLALEKLRRHVDDPTGKATARSLARLAKWSVKLRRDRG